MSRADDFAMRIPIVCECGNHAFVAITKGLTTMVSPDDAHFLMGKWQAQKCRKKKYYRVRRSTYHRGMRRGEALTALVLPLPPGLFADHINCDPLDNRRENLRPATAAENSWNRTPVKRDLPKGVTNGRRKGTFGAAIHFRGARRWLGTYPTPEEAHSAYVAAAGTLYGQFARAQ